MDTYLVNLETATLVETSVLDAIPCQSIYLYCELENYFPSISDEVQGWTINLN